MIKGTQRQMVMLRTSDSDLFEMAYFVLRSDAQPSDSKSMIDEANHIVSSVCTDKKRSKKEKRKRAVRRVFLFVAGVAVGVAVFTLVFWGVRP